MKLIVKKGKTSKRIAIFVQDSSKTTGEGLAGLAWNSASLAWYYWREDEGNTGATSVTLATATRGTFTSGGFVEKDATNLPGWYEIGVPNAALATGANWVGMMLKGATNMAPVPIEIQLVDYEPEDGTRMGLTALPNAAAEAAGGLYTRGTGAGQINQPANGQIDANAVKVGGTVQTGRDIGASVLISSGTAAGQLDVTSGVIKSNLVQILGTVLTETAGLIAAGFKKFFNVATPTGTVNSLPDAAPDAAGGLPVTGNRLTAIPTIAAVTTVTTTTNVTNPVSITAGAVQAIWDAATSALTAANSIGKKLADWVLGSDSKVILSNNAHTGAVVPTVTDLTNAPPDSAGVGTLLTRLSSLRAGYLDNLNVGGNVASSAEATAIQNNTRVVRVVPDVIERPDSGTVTYRIELYLYDDVGNMEAPDSAPTIALVNQGGTDLSARLDSATMALVETGRYRAIYTADAAHALEQLVWTFSVVEGGATRKYGNQSLIVDTSAVDFTSADRTKLEAVFNKLPSKTYLTGSGNSDGDIQLDEATGGLNAAAKLDVNAEVDNALDTAIPGTPTPDSVNERLKTLDDAYTATRAAKLDNADVATSSRATAGDVWANGTRSLTDKDGFRLSATGVDDVFEEPYTGHKTPGTFGALFQALRDGTAQAGAASTITLDTGASAVDDFYNNTLIKIVDGTGAGQARFISDYVGSTKVATVNAAWSTNPDATSEFVILPFGSIPGATAPTAAENANAIWDELTSEGRTGGSYGQLLKDMLNATVGSRAPESGGNVAAIKTKTDQLAFTTGNVHSHTKAQDDLALTAQQKLDVNAEVDSALNTAIPGAPTADSINERVKTLDDSYTVTRAAKLDNADVASSTLATAANLATAKTVIDAIDAKTTNLPTDPADQSLIIAATNALAALIGTPVASVSADVAAVKSVVDAVKVKTDPLPTDPADQSAVEAAITAATTPLATAAALATVGTDVLARATPAQVNAEVSDVLKVDTIADRSVATPPATPTFEQALSYCFLDAVSKQIADQPAGKRQLFNKAGVKIAEATVTDAAGISTVGALT